MGEITKNILSHNFDELSAIYNSLRNTREILYTRRLNLIYGEDYKSLVWLLDNTIQDIPSQLVHHDDRRAGRHIRDNEKEEICQIK